jgi:replication initiation protein RepC
MGTYALTTSFGRRPATLGQITAQMMTRRAVEEAGSPGSNTPAAVNKWALFRTLTDIRERLGVSDRALSVLNALLSFHPETALTLPKPGPSDAGTGERAGKWTAMGCELVVFPSNKALALRAHGMAASTLWRHLTALVDAGLILRRDSPNGKRYARKETAGPERFADAFGFDLTPLVARAAEFEAVAEELALLRRQRELLKEHISLLRRDVGKLIGLGLDAGLPGGWDALSRRAMALMTPLRRLRTDDELTAIATDLGALRAEAANLLESHVDAQNMVSNAVQTDMHESNSKTQPVTESEPAFENQGDALSASNPGAVVGNSPPVSKFYPLGMIMEACPDVREYAPGARIRGWGDFLAAAATVRPMIGISPDAWREAQEALGLKEAHVVVATILQRSIHSSEIETLSNTDGTTRIVINGSPAIRSAGGYLRALTEKARAGEFALGPILMALIGQRLKARSARGK